MQRLRERRKEEGITKSFTRAEKKMQRKMWREYKQMEALTMSNEKKTKRLEQRRRRYHHKKFEKGTEIYIPNSPEEYAKTVQSLVEKASPRKKAALAERGITPGAVKVTEKLCESMQTFKQSRKSSDRRELQKLVSAVDRDDLAVHSSMMMR